MSYSAQAKGNGISVGSKAGKDVILAKASYDASEILLRAARRPRGGRLAYIREAMRRYGPGSKQLFEKERQTLLRRGWAPNQATYDAMRLVASNALAREGMQAIRAALATRVSGEFAEGLGEVSDEGRAVGCGITGGVTAIGSIVAGIYTGGAGAGAVGAGGSIAGSALECNKEALESQERIAAAQAQQAQQQANAALAVAEAEERAAQERTKMVTRVAAIGGSVLLLFGIGYAIVKA